jgi:hypothetical protein
VLLGAPGGRIVAVAGAVVGEAVALAGAAVAVSGVVAVVVGVALGVRVGVAVAVAVAPVVAVAPPPGRRKVAVGPRVGRTVGVRVGGRVEVGRRVAVGWACASDGRGVSGATRVSATASPSPATSPAPSLRIRTTGRCSHARRLTRNSDPRYNYRTFDWKANLPGVPRERTMTNRPSFLLRWFAGALAASLIVISGAAAAQTPAQATLTLSDLTLAPGSSGTVEAALGCSPQCGAVALTLTFDPAVLQIDRVRLGGAFGEPAAGAIAALENAVDNGGGRLDLALLAALPVPQPADALLFSLDVTALAAGQSALTAARADFSDLRGAPLAGEVVGGLIAVQDGVVAIATPAPAEPTAAATEAAAVTATPPSTGEACFVSTVVQGVPIHVGPDRNRAIRGSLPTGEDVPVTGQFTDVAGQIWWRVQPAGVTTELDRYWVLESEVDERGDCAAVPQTEGSAVISTGAGFSHAFTPGERQFQHVVTLPGGNSVITCSGNPIYPEFQVGNQRSNGQTSINLTGAGAQTLTVFATVVNRQGQQTAIRDYSCTLARR